jgi:hypothetical protein
MLAGASAQATINGWILVPVVVITDDEGHRWGDEMAGTKAVEFAE